MDPRFWQPKIDQLTRTDQLTSALLSRPPCTILTLNAQKINFGSISIATHSGDGLDEGDDERVRGRDDNKKEERNIL